MGIDHQTRRISLSIKEVMIKEQMGEGEKEAPLSAWRSGRSSGVVDDSKPYGLFVRLPLGTRVRGLLPMEE